MRSHTALPGFSGRMRIAAGWLSNLILDYMPDLPEIMVHLLSFTALFVGFYYLGRMLASMLEATFKRMSLDWLNRLSGGLVASAKGAILLSLLFMYIAFLPLQKTLAPWQKESVLHEPLYDLVPTVYKKIGSPEDLPEKVREILEKSRERIIEDALKEIEDDIRDHLD